LQPGTKFLWYVVGQDIANISSANYPLFATTCTSNRRFSEGLSRFQTIQTVTLIALIVIAFHVQYKLYT